MLNLKEIRKSYDGATILDGISLDIPDGETVSVLGITDLDSGQIVFDGKDVSGLPAEQRAFNIVFQDYALFPNLNAHQNIIYGLKNKPGTSTKEEEGELIGLLGLSEHLDKKIDQLSGGQKQRVALARTMVKKPKLLLLEEALTLSDRVLILSGGKISQYYTSAEIIHHPGNHFVKTFMAVFIGFLAYPILQVLFRSLEAGGDRFCPLYRCACRDWILAGALQQLSDRRSQRGARGRAVPADSCYKSGGERHIEADQP